MDKEVHIVYHLEATANTEGDVTVYTTPKGWDLVTKEVNVAFDTSVDYDLEVSLYNGIRKVVPTEGVYVGKGMAFNSKREVVFQEDSDVTLHYKNSNATTDRDAIIEIIGVLRSK